MAKIHVLDKHLAELIAAGEVVERPASVVKELLENAIDAHAQQITVAIESGGVRLIEISDNGSGIEAEYIDTAFIRHATSKIQSEEDLNSIGTLGFRGEALASIASVSRVEVLTKTEQDEFACSYRIEGGEALGMDVSARAVGTTIRVRDLFYNTPARMKFLKKDASEGTFVADLVGHVALSHPEISFKFIREGKVQYVTPGDGDLRSAAYAVLGREFARDLVAVSGVSGDCGSYAVSGYVSPPKNCRASRSMQYFYINGRYVKNRTMMAALENAYKGTLMHGKFPGCVLSLQMPVDLVDVNVHPAKTEVRFAREKEVFEAVYRTVKAALTQTDKDMRVFSFGTSPSVATDTVLNMPITPLTTIATSEAATQRENPVPKSIPTPQSQQLEPPQIQSASMPIAPRVTLHSGWSDAPAKGLEERYAKERGEITGLPLAFTPTRMHENVLDIHPEEPACIPPHTIEPILEMLPEEMQDEISADVPEVGAEVIPTPSAEPIVEITPSETVQTTQTSLYPTDAVEPLRYIGEVFKTYIITQRGDSICLIDKHAAHERMIYESILADYGNVASQMLLQAVTVNLSASEKQALLEHQDMIEQAGLELDDFGGLSILVRAVPSDIEVQDIEGLVVELASKLAKGSKDVMSSKTEWVLHSIACRAAMKAGDHTEAQALLHLAEQILSGDIPPYCPHGRPCIVTLTRKELEKQFGRVE